MQDKKMSFGEGFLGGLAHGGYGNYVEFKNAKIDRQTAEEDRQRKLGYEEEDRANAEADRQRSIKRGDIVFGNSLTLFALGQQDRTANEPVVAAKRKSDIATLKAQETLATWNSKKLDDQTRQQARDVYGAFRKVTVGEMPIDAFNSTFKQKLKGVKPIGEGLYEVDNDGKTEWKIDHPEKDGDGDIEFGLTAEVELSKIPDVKRRDAVITLNRALRGGKAGEEAKMKINSQYRELESLLGPDGGYDPNAKHNARKQVILNAIDVGRLNAAKNMTPFDETPYLNEIKSLDKKIEDGETRPNTDPNKPPATGGGLGNLVENKTPETDIGNYAIPPKFTKPYAETVKDGRGRPMVASESLKAVDSAVKTASQTEIIKTFTKGINENSGRSRIREEATSKAINLSPRVYARAKELLGDKPNPSQLDITTATRQAAKEIFDSNSEEEKKKAQEPFNYGNYRRSKE